MVVNVWGEQLLYEEKLRQLRCISALGECTSIALNLLNEISLFGGRVKTYAIGPIEIYNWRGYCEYIRCCSSMGLSNIASILKCSGRQSYYTTVSTTSPPYFVQKYEDLDRT
jgi:hypothetical protein